MRILREQDGSFLVSKVEPHLHDLFRGIPAAADPEENAAARDRLFPMPLKGSEAEEFREEWREFVQPGLRHWFENAVVTVETDLEQLDDKNSFVIPAKHVDAWLNALNQARLALAAKFGIGEEDMDRDSAPLENERDFVLFQIHFYGFIQECLVVGAEGDAE